MHSVMATLCEYWREGIHPKSRFGRIIVPLVIVKIAIISMIGAIFFGPSTKLSVNPPAVAVAVFSFPPSSFTGYRQ